MVIVTLSGTLAYEPWTDRLRSFLEQHFINDGVKEIRLDLGEVDRIDLEGVATLIVLRREAEARGKRLVVEHAQGSVRRRLELTGVLELLEDGRPRT